EASLGVGALGGYAVPINWHAKGEEIAHVLADSSAKAVVVHADLLSNLCEVCPPGVPMLVVATPDELAGLYHLSPDRCAVPTAGDDRGEESGGQFVSGGKIVLRDWDAWLSEHAPFEGKRSQAPASMIYTSGTTGRAKGVRRKPLTADQIAALRRVNADVLGIVPGMRTVIPAPLYHSAPNTYALSALRGRGLVVLQGRFDPEELLALIERHAITRLQLVPTMFIRLLRLPDEVKARYDLSSLEHVVHAAAPCPVDVKRAMIEWWGPIIFEYYGSTESGPVTTCDSAEWLTHPGTVGHPVPGAEIRVIGEGGVSVASGETGEIYMHFPDYGEFTYQNASERRAEIELDGFITVGDLGYLDEDGFLYLCDRKNDMVISGGANIYPARIEATILGLEGVADCAVFGIPDPDLGEVVAAAVQPQPGATVTEDEVRSHVGAHLARFEVPRVVTFHDALPREDSGKIFKRRLRDPYWADSGRSI
ncbi:MAG: AMP-binding protein, partial [Actinobacteria bacterium]|nr:AMP-binding protein [Actinomycetota bacterium]